MLLQVEGMVPRFSFPAETTIPVRVVVKVVVYDRLALVLVFIDHANRNRDISVSLRWLTESSGH